MVPVWESRCATSEQNLLAMVTRHGSQLMGDSLILAINQIGLAEGLALGRSLGIDPLLLHNVVNTSSGEQTCTTPKQHDTMICGGPIRCS